MTADELVHALDEHFRVPDVRDDDWSGVFRQCDLEPYRREYCAGYEGKWNGIIMNYDTA